METNARGIPRAPFVDDVSSFLKGSNHEQTLLKFQEMIQKYRFMETHLLTRQQGLVSKIPDIKKTLDVVRFMVQDKEFVSDVEINDTLWIKTRIPPQKTVNLWLGANVMLEYPLPEAIDLLEQKRQNAETSLVQVREDLEYIKEQITTMEVNMARVYNDDVKQRKK
jgi:prefoldin subunit 5